MQVSGSEKSGFWNYATRFMTAALMVTVLLTGCAGNAPVEAPDSPATEATVAEARQAAEIGEYAYALELLSGVLPDTREPEVASQAAQLAVALEDWEAALAAGARWRALEPESQQAVQVSLLAALRLGREALAAELLADELIGDAVDPDEAWDRAALVLARGGDAALAGRVIDRALARSGSDRPGLAEFLKSRVLAAQERRAEAYELASEAYRAEPGLDRATWAARLAQAQSLTEESLEWFESASGHDPTDRAALIGRVQLLRELGRPVEALALLAEAPADAELLYTRGVLEQELGRSAAAGATWQQLAGLASDSGAGGERHAWLTALLAELLELNDRAEAWYARVEGGLKPRADLRRAAVLARESRLEAARALLTELRLDSGPEIREQSWLLEATILSEAGEHRRAIELLSQALTQLPASEDLLYSRAMAAVGADELALAEQDLRAIIQNDPDNAVALNALGYTLSDRTDRQREALRLIETALELDPDNPAILDSMGWVLFRLGRPADALDYLERAASAQPHPEIVAHLIEVLWELDRRDEALAWVDRAGDGFEDDPVYRDTLDRLGIE